MVTPEWLPAGRSDWLLHVIGVFAGLWRSGGGSWLVDYESQSS